MKSPYCPWTICLLYQTDGIPEFTTQFRLTLAPFSGKHLQPPLQSLPPHGPLCFFPPCQTQKQTWWLELDEGRSAVKRRINTELQHFATSTWFVQTQICTGCTCLSCNACWDTVGGELYVCVTNCGPLSTCLCSLLWRSSVENCDTPVNTAVVCRKEALDAATLSHSLKTLFFRKDWDPHWWGQFQLWVSAPAAPAGPTARSVLEMTRSQPQISVDTAWSKRAARKLGLPNPRVRNVRTLSGLR